MILLETYLRLVTVHTCLVYARVCRSVNSSTGSPGASTRSNARKPKCRGNDGRMSDSRSDWERRTGRGQLLRSSHSEDERSAVIGFRPLATHTVAAVECSSSGETIQVAARGTLQATANKDCTRELGAHDTGANARHRELPARLAQGSPFHAPLEKFLSLNGAVVTLYPKCVCTFRTLQTTLSASLNLHFRHSFVPLTGKMALRLNKASLLFFLSFCSILYIQIHSFKLSIHVVGNLSDW